MNKFKFKFLGHNIFLKNKALGCVLLPGGEAGFGKEELQDEVYPKTQAQIVFGRPELADLLVTTFLPVGEAGKNARYKRINVMIINCDNNDYRYDNSQF